jgi:hypothetical protein
MALRRHSGVHFSTSIGTNLFSQRGYAEASYVFRKTTDLIEDFQTVAGGFTDVVVQGVPAGKFTNILYDNTDLAAHPLISLTSVDQSGVDMGSQAIGMLLERIQGRTESREYVVTPSLRIRTSTAATASSRTARPPRRTDGKAFGS